MKSLSIHFLLRVKSVGKHIIFDILHATALMLLGVLLSICLSTAVYAEDIQKSRVLVLNSYKRDLPWTENIVKGIESVLEKGQTDVDLTVEYMHSKTVPFDAAYQKKLIDLYTHRYKDYKFDVIITSDDNAFNFVREHYEDVFSGSNVVFCGVNNVNAPDIVDRTLFTGIIETTAEKETIDLIHTLHTGIKRIVLIVGTTPSGSYRWKQLEKSFQHFPEIEFVRLDDSYSISEIENKMKNLTDDTVAIFASLYRDKSGRFISLNEGASRISEASKRPIYTFHLQVLQYGTIGGKLLAGEQHGRMAAEMALRIIQGEKAERIPIVKESLAEYIFDYSQLKRFNIQETSLPPSSIIRNRPFSLYEEFKVLVWTISLVILLLIIIIITLQINIAKRKQAEKQIKVSLLEKEVLLREIHHRVKNSYAIIIGLLNLQGSNIKDEGIKSIFRDSAKRIRSMSLVHELLYSAENLSMIDFGNYVETLARIIFKTYKISPARIKIKVDIKDIQLNTETSVPLGLVVNELVSNAMKYAFPGDRDGEIIITMQKIDSKNEYELTIEDNGTGLPEGFDIHKTDTLGLRLVTMMVENQLGGNIEVKRDRGTKFKIRCEALEYKNRMGTKV